ncbi:hypothetical protein SAY87_011983 [Trapa incisa]|uniref:Mitochondrial glycoprotein family protein n=1 Tax=Trapa incisa TaxID=236973 RepID=A0AAN7JBU3_9MYRT|nr:hypothetical protein SAY87_011983 [Trapa incisa]
MARLVRCLRSLVLLSSHDPSIIRTRPDHCLPLSRLMDARVRARSFVPSAAATTCVSETPKSPFDCNIIRILRGEINYELELHRLPKPVDQYNSFVVEDRPAEQWISLKRKYGDNEDITIKATMFDGAIPVQGAVDADGNEAMQLHITMLVSISKGETGDMLEFICSALPRGITILKLFTRSPEKIPPQAYLGPKFNGMDEKLQNSMYAFLERRGVSDELAGFLHDYMWNKDKIELISWMRTVESFLEK